VVAVGNGAADNLACQFGLDVLLQEPLDRTGAVCSVVGFVRNELLGRVCQLQRDLTLCQSGFNIRKTQFDDPDNLILGQRREDYDVVDSVQELRTEVFSFHSRPDP